jgi:hypothetical protein
MLAVTARRLLPRAAAFATARSMATVPQQVCNHKHISLVFQSALALIYFLFVDCYITVLFAERGGDRAGHEAAAEHEAVAGALL